MEVMEYVTFENGLHAFEVLFWPSFWTVTYVCALALLVTAFQYLYKRAGFGSQAIAYAGPVLVRPGVSLMIVGALGFAVCSVLWAVLFGDLGRAVSLLVHAHIHGTQDWRETILLVVSTLSVLAADIGSLIFLDRLPT